MKLELKPGVSPAYFWTSIAIGLGGTAATALSLTAYAWAATAAALIALIVGFVRGNVKPPPGAQLILLFALCSALFAPSCSQLSVSQRAAIAQSIVPLSELGLSLAQSRGVIQEGDRVIIGRGVALIMEDGVSTRDKVVRLSALGVQAAVERGALQEGDALLIREATAIIDRALPQAQTSAKNPSAL